jgi:hypothetical protein
VTGLAGHAFGSWKSREEQQMWLRDFLPNAIKRARILTYGYDTKLPGSQSSASILELSKKLLESVKTIRNQQNVRHWQSALTSYVAFEVLTSCRGIGLSSSSDIAWVGW